MGEFTQEIAGAGGEALAAIEENREKIKQQQNLKQKTKELKIGNNVWLENVNLKTNRPTKKLDYWRYGPFEITEKIGQGAYWVKLPEQWVIHDVFNEDLLTKCQMAEYKCQEKAPPLTPDIIEGEEEFEIEEVQGHHKQGKGIQYLVHWKGYSNKKDEWIHEEFMEHTEELVNEYKQRIQEKPLKEGGKVTK
jgi:hypothetical protein